MARLQVVFWGTRGSLPRSPGPVEIRRKLRRALVEAVAAGLGDEEDIDEFLSARLSFASRSTYGGNTPCVELRGGDDLVVLDAGSGLRELSRELDARASDGPIRAHILMSHLHWDHVQGFPYFGPAYVAGNEVHVYGFHDGIEEAFVRQQRPPSFPVPLDQMAATISFHRLHPGESRQVGGFRVRGILQNHPGDSYGYALERDGWKVVYSTDAEHTEDAYDEDYPFLDFARDADLLIFDAAYTLAEQMVAKRDWGHSSNILGVELAVRAGARHLCLFHHDPSLSDEDLERISTATQRYLELFADPGRLRIDVAYDGMTVTLQ